MMNMEVVSKLEAFVNPLLLKAKSDFQKEMIARAHIYTWRRMENGLVTTFAEAKVVFAAFADGYCTGKHGDGASCQHAGETSGK